MVTYADASLLGFILIHECYQYEISHLPLYTQFPTDLHQSTIFTRIDAVAKIIFRSGKMYVAFIPGQLPFEVYVCAHFVIL